jgi:hypothetical protein
MFTITFKKQDRKRIKDSFGAKPVSERPTTATYRGAFDMDALAEATESGLVFYGQEDGKPDRWGFASDGKFYALMEIDKAGNAIDRGDGEADEYRKMLDAVKRRLERAHRKEGGK